MLDQQTNKRHNSSCRNYQKPKGKLGNKGEGSACKVVVGEHIRQTVAD